MTESMTGYAVRDGSGEGWRWTWEVRSVNGRGLDLRLRLPEWPGEIEPIVRERFQKALSRGNVTVSLRMARDETSDQIALNHTALSAVLEMAGKVEAAAKIAGVGLAPMSAADVLGLKGVVVAGAGEEDPAPVRQAMINDIDPILNSLTAARASEGAALEAVLRSQVDAVDKTVTAARELREARSDHLAQLFRDALERVMGQGARVDEARVSQEIATLAVKADVSEELDRLDAHVAAARALLDGDGPKGRKLDFLTQEFNREANTLCSKSAFAELSRLGLDLKHTVDQMREQVQNVE